jgi:hypothetical protein
MDKREFIKNLAMVSAGALLVRTELNAALHAFRSISAGFSPVTGLNSFLPPLLKHLIRPERLHWRQE